MFGPAAPVTADEAGQVVVGVDTRDSAGRFTGKKVSAGDGEFRRSLYVQVRRSMPLSVTEVFDAPVMSPNCELRTSSTVAPQSLMLMNNEFALQQSDLLARRVEKADAGTGLPGQVRLAWRLALTDFPTPAQVASGVSFIEQQRNDFVALFDADPEKTEALDLPDLAHRALANFCQALLSSNAFLYID
jgi:hypothetical protein